MTESRKGGLNWYWKRRPYQRLDGSVSGVSRRPRNKAEFGTGRRRFWQFRVSPRLRFLRRLASPKRLLSSLRDAYVRMMMSLAGSRSFAGGYGYGGEAVAGFGRSQVKEYDEKVLVEMYKKILAQGDLFNGADHGRGAVSRVVVRGVDAKVSDVGGGGISKFVVRQ